jgi:hypothetical protein
LQLGWANDGDDSSGLRAGRRWGRRSWPWERTAPVGRCRGRGWASNGEDGAGPGERRGTRWRRGRAGDTGPGGAWAGPAIGTRAGWTTAVRHKHNVGSRGSTRHWEIIFQSASLCGARGDLACWYEIYKNVGYPWYIRQLTDECTGLCSSVEDIFLGPLSRNIVQLYSSLPCNIKAPMNVPYFPVVFHASFKDRDFKFVVGRLPHKHARLRTNSNRQRVPIEILAYSSSLQPARRFIRFTIGLYMGCTGGATSSWVICRSGPSVFNGPLGPRKN